ncbi:MAG: LysR family transcriptional regulator [Bacillus sp. (in: firmicutes)]
MNIFVKVYEVRNFTKAAEALFLSQPTISTQILNLEKKLNVTLFTRKGRHEIIPTEDADFLYKRALTILDNWEDTVETLNSQGIVRTKCRIACSNTCGIYFLPAVMPSILKNFADIDFSIQLMNSEEVVTHLKQNKADLGFIEKFVDTEGLKRSLVSVDQLVLAGDFHSPYWLNREEDSGTQFYSDMYLKETNLKPIHIHLNNSEMIAAFLKAGIGQAVISKQAVPEGVEWLPLSPRYTRNFYFLAKESQIKQRINELERFLMESVGL